MAKLQYRFACSLFSSGIANFEPTRGDSANGLFSLPNDKGTAVYKGIQRTNRLIWVKRLRQTSADNFKPGRLSEQRERRWFRDSSL